MPDRFKISYFRAGVIITIQDTEAKDGIQLVHINQAGDKMYEFLKKLVEKANQAGGTHADENPNSEA